MKRLKDNKAFTLTEIVAVVVILGIVCLIAVPSISEHVLKSKETMYENYTRNMESATENMVVECIAGNKENCVLPTNGESTLVYLKDLVEEGYSDKLEDPENDGYCDLDKSYVIIQSDSSNGSSYEYKACLYCSSYKSDTQGCIEYTDDGAEPKCGTVTGEVLFWTNENRTVTVGCIPGDDNAISACRKQEFSKTFTTSTPDGTGTVNIQSKNGKTTSCPVTVRVDKDAPTCTLKVSDGSVAGVEGWYSGDVKVEFDTKSDTGGSGIETYGMGTSMENRTYNKKTSQTVGNGVTTVFGYVKDYAGNEGICSLEIKSDQISPEQTVQVGYQIYPDKETATTSGLTVSGNSYTTTASGSYIDISGLTEYRQAAKVVLYFAEGLSKGVTGEVWYRASGNSYVDTIKVTRTMVQGDTQAIFELPEVATYDGIKIGINDPDGTGFTYKLSKIELIADDNSVLYTNKDVTLYINGTDTVTGVYQASYDNGATWGSVFQKTYSSNQQVYVKTKDKAGNISDATLVDIANIDKTNPTCKLQTSGTKPSGSDWYTSDVTVSFKSYDDNLSGVRTRGIGSISGGITAVHTTDNTSGVTYTGYVLDKAGNSNTCSITFKRNADYTVTYNNNSGSGCTTLAATYGAAYGTLCTPTRTGYTFAGWYKNSGFATQVTSTTTVTDVDDHTLYAKWTANTYTIKFNGNSNTGGSTASVTCTYDQNCALTSNGFTRTNYDFLGWSTSSSATSATYTNGQSVKNLATSGTVNLYAVWKLALVTRCKYRDYSSCLTESCSTTYCCERNAKNNYCISCTDCSCNGGWKSWSNYSASYTSYTSSSTRNVRCCLFSPTAAESTTDGQSCYDK